MGKPINVTLKPGEHHDFLSGFISIKVTNESAFSRGKIAIVFSNGNEEGKTIEPNRSVKIANPQALAFKATDEGQTNLFIQVETA